MSCNEARDLLVERMQHYMNQPYEQLEQLIGGEHVTRLHGVSGKDFFFELYVSRSCDRPRALDIEGFISEVNGSCVMSALEHIAYRVDCDSKVRGIPPELQGQV